MILITSIHVLITFLQNSDWNIMLEKNKRLFSDHENKVCLRICRKQGDWSFSVSYIDCSTKYGCHGYVINGETVPPSPSLSLSLSLSLFTFANQLWACFLPHPNKWHVNPAGTAGWKWVLKGISKWHFNKDVCGDIMGPNESNVFADVLTAWHSPSWYPCLSLMGWGKEKTEGEEIWRLGPTGEYKLDESSLCPTGRVDIV